MGNTVKRMSMIDVWKLVFAVLIMLHHSYVFGIPQDPENPYHFMDAWIYVEFYFMVSGYFTAAHFARAEVPSEQRGAYAMKYTLQKYKPLFAISLIAILTAFALNVWNGDFRSFWYFLRYMEELLFEVSFLTGSGLAAASVPSIWYLSTMFLVLPLICWLLLSDKAHGGIYRSILSWLFPVLVYGFIGVKSHTSSTSILYSLLRAAACLSLGVFLYEICRLLAGRTFSKAARICGTVLEISALLFTVYLSYCSQGYFRLSVVLLAFALTLFFSGISYSSAFSFKWARSISLLSLIVYMVHWPLFWQVHHWMGDVETRFRYKILVAMGVSFAYSFLVLLFYQKVIARRIHK